MKRPAAELDIENLVDFFQVKISEGTKIHNFPLWPGSPPLDIAALMEILARVTIHTFNGINYDLPILTLALHGATHEMLKKAGDDIIVRQMKWWEFYKHYNVTTPACIDHVDLFDVAPGVAIGLKMYMGRTHAPKMQDLPVAFDVPIVAGERLGISVYCDNDLQGTRILREEMKERLVLRESISEQYKIDVRSKSDAQIAEAVIKAQLDFTPDRRYIPHGYTFNYEPPAYIRFVSKQLNDLLHICSTAPFLVSDKEEALAMGHEDMLRTGVIIPEALKGRDICIGNGKYRIGIGGIHSQESSVNYVAGDHGDFTIKDVDVKSYYPRLITSIGMYPQQLGPAFSHIYNKVIDRRLAAKAEAQKLFDLGFIEDAHHAQSESDGLKIVGNGTFGKFFSKYSILYAPELGIRVTITGQLALLMLIEMMEMTGISVASANTDGIVLLIPAGYEPIARANVAWWERATGLEMEETDYRAIYMRDVNNYLAITTGGKVKRKGVFAQGGLLSGPGGKHPDKDICADAVVAYLRDGTPIEQTIRGCTDIRKFVQVRAVKGGAIDLPAGVAISEGKYLGKAVRWYHSGRPGYIGYNHTGNKVAGSDGATPIMELPAYLPADINYQHYIHVAMEMLKDVGV